MSDSLHQLEKENKKLWSIIQQRDGMKELVLSHVKDALKKFKENFPEQVAYYHLRYFSKLGSIARLICFAAFLKVKKIYFVGMDGYPGKTGLDYKHAFEDESLKKINHDGRIFSYHLHKRQYVLFWDYLLNMLQNYNITYQNLGEGHPANQSSDISRKEFPLQI